MALFLPKEKLRGRCAETQATRWHEQGAGPDYLGRVQSYLCSPGFLSALKVISGASILS